MSKSVGLGTTVGWYVIVAITSGVCLGQGVISTVAGNGTNAATGDGGPALSASFHPDGLTLDSAGNIYIADQNHHRIRKVDRAGVITTVAGNGNTGIFRRRWSSNERATMAS